MATKEIKTQSASVDILKNPRVTEKAANAQTLNTYTFDVAVGATKSEIAKAFTMQYKHTPVSVRTANVKRKTFFRKGKLGFGAAGKKAYITLPKGKTIDVI